MNEEAKHPANPQSAWARRSFTASYERGCGGLSEAENPVEWAMFYELFDAQEHLEELIAELAGGSIDADKLRIDIGHVYAHLNRAWYRSKGASEIPDAQWDVASAFPQDVTPVG